MWSTLPVWSHAAGDRPKDWGGGQREDARLLLQIQVCLWCTNTDTWAVLLLTCAESDGLKFYFAHCNPESPKLHCVWYSHSLLFVFWSLFRCFFSIITNNNNDNINDLLLSYGFLCSSVLPVPQQTPTWMTSASSYAAPAIPVNLVPNDQWTTQRATSTEFPSVPILLAWLLDGCALMIYTTK